jgi:hypothetical protein
MMKPMIAAIANANELMGYSCTNSISVPKLPFGCINATVVPRLPGRGALSIAVAPAAIIAASASAQLFTRYPMWCKPSPRFSIALATGESGLVGVSN